MENKENKKEVEKMGAFIDQVQKNNAIQREQLTYKKQKQLEKEAKQQEKEDMKMMRQDVREQLTYALDQYFNKYDDAEHIKSTFEIIENRNNAINQLFKKEIEKDEAHKIYYDILDKLYKQHKKDEEARAEMVQIEEEKRERKRQEQIKKAVPKDTDVVLFSFDGEYRIPRELATPEEIALGEEYAKNKAEHYEKVVKPTNEHFRKLAEREKRQKKLENFRTTLYVLNWIVNILLLIFCFPLGLLFCFLTAVEKSKNNNKF